MNASLSLRNRVVNAASWTVGGHISGHLLRLISNLIMTRLLVPEMFGVMAIGYVIMNGLAMMSDVGIRQHIIQSKLSDSADYLNTAWVLQILRGGLLWVIALIISWVLVAFADSNLWPPDSVYAHPSLPYVIVALSFTAFINGFESTKLALANRNLAMNMVVKIEIGSKFIGIVSMITWAYVDRSIWALVFGALVTSLLKSALSHMVLPGHNNKLHWDSDSLYELLHFGKWMFLSSTLGFLVINGDKIVLGGLIDVKHLGVYTIAIFVISAIQQLLARISQSVALPAFSEVVRDRPGDLKKTYYKFRLPLDGTILFLVGILFMAGHHVIDILYDDRYQAAGHMIEILSLSLIAERYSLTSFCFMALGKPSYLIPIIMMRIPILFLLLPMVYREFGFDASLWVIALCRLAEWPILFYLKIKMSLLSLVKEMYFMLFLLCGLFVGWVINYVFLFYMST